MFRIPVVLTITALNVLTIIASSCTAQSTASTGSSASVEFRIDTDVYTDPSRPPVASNKTLFVSNRIIDWDEANRRMMRIDLAGDQIELADFSTQRRCRIEMHRLAAQLSELKTQLTPEQEQAWASPNGPIAESGGFLLESKNQQYRFKTAQPRDPSMAAAYAEFADWSVHVSALYPPYKPPLLRMQLNAYLSESGMLPTEIQLTDLRSTTKDVLVARILVQDSLTNQDRERIKDWDVLVQTLKMVSDQEFFQADRVARQRKPNTK